MIMVDSVDPASSNSKHPSKRPHNSSSKKVHDWKNTESNKEDGGPTTKFLGMEVTQKQKEKIYQNMCKMIVDQIKRDTARQKEASQKLRESIDN